MRYNFIDTLRGIAFILMVIHHIFYFYDVSNNYKTSYANNQVVDVCGTIARTLFIFLAGFSLSLYKNKNKNKKKNIKKRLSRSIQIFIHAMIISLVTLIFYPNYFIRWGVLHFLGLATFLAYYFVDKPKILTFITALIFYFVKFPPTDNKIIDTIIGSKTYYNMMDYFPLQKWFSLLLFGLLFGQIIDLDKINNIDLNILNSNNILTKIGENSLNLYTVHIILLIIIYNIKNILIKA